jgi:hypothetical protein
MRYDTHTVALKSYIKEKIKMLKDREGLNINLSKEEEKNIWSLSTEIAVDNYVRTIILNKL